jgi:hypothetical protein
MTLAAEALSDTDSEDRRLTGAEASATGPLRYYVEMLTCRPPAGT